MSVFLGVLYLWAALVFVRAAWSTIQEVGKPRKPLTHQSAAATVFLAAVLVWLMVLAAIARFRGGAA